MKSANSQSGQALLLILLAMAAALTIAFSIVSRSVSDISVTTKEEESLRAFSAAEAGIEEVLVSNMSEGAPPITDSLTEVPASYNAKVTGFPESSNVYLYPIDMEAGEVATIWFVSHDTDGSLTCDPPNPCFNGNLMDVCWGRPVGSTTPTALEVSVLYDHPTYGLQITRVVLDSEIGRIPNSLTASTTACNLNDGIRSQTFKYQKQINFETDLGISSSLARGSLKLAKIRVLFNNTTENLGVKVSGGSDNLPSQGRRVESTGTSGESVRRVDVYELYPDTPSIFDSAVFSPQSITK